MLAFALGGCSSVTTHVDAGPDASIVPLPSPAVSPVQACRDIATAAAQREVACQRMAASDETSFIAAQCPTDWYTLEMGDFDAGLLAYSQSAVNCVVTFHQQLGCNFPLGSNPQCPPLAWGVLTTGQSCGSQYACQPGLYCQFVGGDSCGTCQPASPIGGPCGGSANGATCLQGQCNGAACATVVSAGGDCQYGTSVCAPGLSCQGTCYPPGPVGTGCATDADCLDGLTCPPFGQQTCVQRAALGASCAELSCALGAGCAWNLDGGTSCQTLNAGGSCVDDLDGGLCLEQQHCVDGGCQPLGVAGDPCGQDADCAVGRCISSSCTLLTAGTPCNRDRDCVTNNCNFSAVVPTCVAACMQ